MEVVDAIRERRAVRDYLEDPIDEQTIRDLIEAATLAPSAVNVQPWAFVVVQDPDLLKRISDRAKLMLMHSSLSEPLQTMLARPGYNIFYNAGTLILVCARPDGAHPDWDCCLAGENLMLAARDRGLGTCVIGFAWPALDLEEIREDLGIPEGYAPVLPIIVGHPRAVPESHGRKPPEILSWKKPGIAVVG